MVTSPINTPANVVEKSILLTGEVMRYLLNKPEVFRVLPDNFELVILPEDDPEMRLYNLDLLDKFANEDRPMVLARLKTQREPASHNFNPSFFVPFPLAA